MIALEHELDKIKGFDKRFVVRLKNLNIHTVRDLLYHFPFRYEDYSTLTRISDLEPGQTATISGVIKKVNVKNIWKRHMVIVEAIVTDGTGLIRAVWFNQPFLVRNLHLDKPVNFAGKTGMGQSGLTLNNPQFEYLSPVKSATHTGQLTGKYSETKGLTSKGLRYLIKILLQNLKLPEDFLPKEVLEMSKLPEIKNALVNIHFPKKIEDTEKARERFAFESLFLLQLNNLELKSHLSKAKALSSKVYKKDWEEILKTLPFELTVEQKKATLEILKDIRQPHPMNRLLQGDVGSGKTVVATAAALITAKNGWQVAFLAPTEVLANQHYETIKKIFSELIPKWEINLALMTASSSKVFHEKNLEADMKKSEIVHEIEKGKIKIVVGTHSIIQKDVAFKNLGLVIVDEQHRFGVKQRAHLLNNKENDFIPHLLSMSATPIPRTLSLTLFGDLDISIIKELPKGRMEIKTKIIEPTKRALAYKFINEEIKKGRQVFVICPRIEAKSDSDQDGEIVKNTWSDTKTVKEEYEKLKMTIFPKLKIDMLHGKLKPEEKNLIMKKFKDGKTDILVATSVIEVGVDIQNASIMMIEGAERFGLSQLYQFRGRVGRGEHQSYCFLFTESQSPDVKKRLEYLVEAKNGFELAERDLELRGPGQFLGDKQTGLPDLAMRSLNNVRLIKLAREAAVQIFKNDSSLKKNPLVKARLEDLRKMLHQE